MDQATWRSVWKDSELNASYLGRGEQLLKYVCKILRRLQVRAVVRQMCIHPEVQSLAPVEASRIGMTINEQCFNPMSPMVSGSGVWGKAKSCAYGRSTNEVSTDLSFARLQTASSATVGL